MLTIVPACFEVQSFRNRNWFCIHSVDKLLVLYWQTVTIKLWQTSMFFDLETNPCLRRSVPVVCRILCSNVRGLAGNRNDLTVASYQHDILFCTDLGLRYASRVGVARSRFRSPCPVVSGPWDGCMHTYEMVSEQSQPKHVVDHLTSWWLMFLT